MASRRINVRVFNGRISALFGPGGDGWQEATDMSRKIEQFAVFFAPKRTGELAGSHSSYTLKSGPYGARGYVSNSAEHALWVAKGTREVITSDRPGGVLIRPRARFGLGIANGGLLRNQAVVDKVHGQEANNWIARAARAAGF